MKFKLDLVKKFFSLHLSALSILTSVIKRTNQSASELFAYSVNLKRIKVPRNTKNVLLYEFHKIKQKKRKKKRKFFFF